MRAAEITTRKEQLYITTKVEDACELGIEKLDFLCLDVQTHLWVVCNLE